MTKINQMIEEYSKFRNCIGLCNGQAVGLRRDGTVVVSGVRNLEAIQKISLWRNIVAISIGKDIVTGVKTDGTVLNVNWYFDKDKNTFSTYDSDLYSAFDENRRKFSGKWSDIKSACSPTSRHVFGLKTDGTMLVSPSTTEDDYNKAVVEPISRWRDIAAIFANRDTLVGLKIDGSLVKITWEKATPSHGWGYVYRSTVSNLTNPQGDMIKDVVYVYPHGKKKAYIKSDGTILASKDRLVQLAESADIVSITASTYGDDDESGYVDYYFALKSDGTVVTTEKDGMKIDVSGLRDIVEIWADRHHFIGLTSNGTVVSLARENTEKLNVSDWSNIGPTEESLMIERKRKDAEQARLWKNQGKCRNCGGDFGGLFSKKCKKCDTPK